MSRSNQNRKQRSPNMYTGTGRPFTLTEANPTSARINNLLEADDSMASLSPKHNQEHAGRAFNPLMDKTQVRLARAQQDRRADIQNVSNNSSYSFSEECNRSQNEFFDASSSRLTKSQIQQHLRRLLENKERLDLAHEMATNKNIREQQQLTPCQIQQQVQAALAARKARQLAMANNDPGQQSLKKPATLGKNPACDFIKAGRQFDVNRFYNCNIPAFQCAGKAGRPFEIERDLTGCHMNQTAGKRQRGKSCPPPQRSECRYFPAQQNSDLMQSEYSHPSRSLSPIEARHYDSSQNQSPLRSSQRSAENLAKQVYYSREYSADSSGTNRRPVTRANLRTTSRSPQTSADRSPAKVSERLPEPQLATILQQRSQQGLLCNSQIYTPQMDAEYERAPPGSTLQNENALKTPTKPQNETDHITSARLNQAELSNNSSPSLTNTITQPEIVKGLESVLTITPAMPTDNKVSKDHVLDINKKDTFGQQQEQQRIQHSMEKSVDAPRQRPCPAPQALPQQESFFFIAPLTNDSAVYGRRANAYPANFCVDETQCIVNDLDVSAQTFPPSIYYDVPNQKGSQVQYWRIPTGDFSCCERSNASQQTSLPQNVKQTSVQTMATTNLVLDQEFDSTQYLGLPSSLKASSCSPQNCRPCEQPKGSLFSCLAKRLGLTYDFISSWVAPQRDVEPQVTTERADQMCDTVDFGVPTLHSTARYGDIVHNSMDIYDMNESPASVRECVNAKRCGNVQFDSSDIRTLQDPQCRALRQAQMDSLVNDTYYPGIIQETIDGRKNFNAYSFNMSNFSNSDDPMTLLQAFSMRIDKERAEIVKNLKEDFTADQIADSINKHFNNQNPTDLNQAIKSFLLSEQLLEYDENESNKGNAFEAEVQRWVTAWPGCTQLKLMTYTGLTRPIENRGEQAADVESH